MSYPRTIQTLVIEDESNSKAFYDAVFEGFSKRYPLVQPRYAFCHADGEKALRSDTIFHLVILDLRLPMNPGEPAPDSISYGLNLFDSCAKRVRYPIPVVLIVSGHLEKADQGMLDDRLRKEFAHGRVLVKAGVSLERDIEESLRRVLHYCDIGIHIKDGGSGAFPTLSPREEDLLRRAVMDQGELCIGVDLQWWAAEYAPATSDADSHAGWTKVLMGNFLLNNGRGRSRPTFFKLAAAAGADGVAAEAKLMEAKLPHIKVRGSWIAGDRSLLVTEKVGETDVPPMSLGEFLGRTASSVSAAIPGVVNDVASQLAKLGDDTPDQIPVRKLFWQFHSLDRLKSEWSRWNGPGLVAQLGPEADAMQLFQRLAISQTVVRVSCRTALHGDLNVTNVAIDATPEQVRAYIFDASGMAAGVSIRDLAMLEVTALLHQRSAGPQSLVRRCAAIYDKRVVIPVGEEPPTESGFIGNTVRLITEIRRLPVVSANERIYAATVFDHALMQLGGLAFTVSRNKIQAPEEAAVLCAFVSRWMSQVAGELVG